jgi:TonB family protein
MRTQLLLVLALLFSPLGFGQSQSGTAEDYPCPLFGSTPETRGKLVTLPKTIHKVEPQYPSGARNARIEGQVVLCVTIGKDGNVRGLHAISGPKELIPAAMKAVQRYRFTPFLANNEPVEAATHITVNFNLVK